MILERIKILKRACLNFSKLRVASRNSSRSLSLRVANEFLARKLHKAYDDAIQAAILDGAVSTLVPSVKPGTIFRMAGNGRQIEEMVNDLLEESFFDDETGLSPMVDDSWVYPQSGLYKNLFNATKKAFEGKGYTKEDAEDAIQHELSQVFFSDGGRPKSHIARFGADKVSGNPEALEDPFSPRGLSTYVIRQGLSRKRKDKVRSQKDIKDVFLDEYSMGVTPLSGTSEREGLIEWLRSEDDEDAREAKAFFKRILKNPRGEGIFGNRRSDNPMNRKILRFLIQGFMTNRHSLSGEQIARQMGKPGDPALTKQISKVKSAVHKRLDQELRTESDASLAMHRIMDRHKRMRDISEGRF